MNRYQIPLTYQWVLSEQPQKPREIQEVEAAMVSGEEGPIILTMRRTNQHQETLGLTEIGKTETGFIFIF